MCVQDTIREMSHQITFDRYVRLDEFEFREIENVINQVASVSEDIESDIAQITEDSDDFDHEFELLRSSLQSIHQLVDANSGKMPAAFKPAFARIFKKIDERSVKLTATKKEMMGKISDIAIHSLTASLQD